MRVTRVFVEAALEPGVELELPEASSTHLLRVLRLAAGDPLVLFNGDGHDYAAHLVMPGKRSALVRVDARLPAATESPLRITLAQALARGDKMDWVLQKATELGVHALAPVVTERTEVKLDAERGSRRMSHWQGVIASACEQSGRARLPHLAEPRRLDAFAAEATGLTLALDPEGEFTLNDLPPPDAAGIVLVIGPEGGLSPRDLATLRAAGFRGLRLGPRVLRTETAGLAALAALQGRFGDLG